MNITKPTYLVLADFPENIKEVITYCELSGQIFNSPPLANVQKGDILLFFSLEPINGLVGFATITNIIEVNNPFQRIEFNRSFCLPFLLWREQKIDLPETNINTEMSILENAEEIARISTLIDLRWGVKLEGTTESGTMEKPLFYVNKCIKCGKDIDNRIAKYCDECRNIVKKIQYTEWARKNKDKIREAAKRWRQNHRDKVREGCRRWREAHPDRVKELTKRRRAKNKVEDVLQKLMDSAPPKKIDMSDWCRELRENSDHLSWMERHRTRLDKFIEIENRFSCYWEDKFKEVFENHSRVRVCEILHLDYQTVMNWAKHLNLQRICVYCQKTLATPKGNSHTKCRRNHVSEERTSSINGLLTVIVPTLNAEALSISPGNVIQIVRETLREVLSLLPWRQSFVIENRYLQPDFEKRPTLEQLGATLGVTRERIRQLETEAIRKLSHPSKRKLIREKLMKTIFSESEEIESSLSNRIKELENEINELRQKLPKTEESVIISPKPEITNMPLSAIEMTVRASNCLRHAKIKTIGELASKTKREMFDIRNFGEKTFRELSAILNSYSLNFKIQDNKSMKLDI